MKAHVGLTYPSLNSAGCVSAVSLFLAPAFGLRLAALLKGRFFFIRGSGWGEPTESSIAWVYSFFFIVFMGDLWCRIMQTGLAFHKK